KETSGPGNLLEYGVNANKSERKLLLKIIGFLFEIKGTGKKAPLVHINVCLALAIPKSVLYRETISAKNIDIAAETVVIADRRVALPSALKEGPKCPELDLGSSGTLLDVKL